jgi:hypothetical protein
MSETDQNASERKPSLSEVLDRSKQYGELHTAIPAVVVKYSGGRKVDVQILVRRAYLDESNERQTKSVAVVASVPISWPGAGGYVLTFPISDGQTTVIDGAVPPATTGTLLVAERSIDKWLAGTGAEVDPEIDHNHQLSDGIFLPELRPFGKKYPTTPADHAVIGYDGGVAIHMRKTVVCIGDEAGAAFIARADKVLTELQKVGALFDGVAGHQHVFVGGVVGPPTAGAGAPSGASLYTPSDPAAAQGKVQ